MQSLWRKSSFTTRVGFFGLLFFLLWSRLFMLHQLPATLTHDEMVYAIQARSFLLQGTTLDQTQSWLSLRPSHPMYAELPAQVMMLGFWLSDHPLLATHLTAAIMGILLPFLMALLAWQIWKRTDLSAAIWVVFVLSPLFWQMSRVSYDAWYGLFFYVLGAVLLLSQRRSFVFLSMAVFTLGFFQYQGFKLVLFPWVMLILALRIVADQSTWSKAKLWQSLRALGWRWLVPLFALGLMAVYGFILLPQTSTEDRLESFIFTDTAYLSQMVNDERRLSLHSPWSSLMSNKVTATLLFMLNHLLGVLNPVTLLLLIEPNVSGFSVWTHGVFYWFEVVLMFLGLALLVVRRAHRLAGVLIFIGVLTLCLPALVNTGNPWYLLRSLLSYLLLTLLAGWGLFALWRVRGMRLLVLFAYLLSVINFGYQYFYRYPIISLDWGNFDERVMARYLAFVQEQEPDREIIVYGPEPDYDFWSYLFYTNQLTTENKDMIATSMQTNPPFSKEAVHQIGKVTFSSYCAPNDPTMVATYGGADAAKQPLLIVRKDHKVCPIDAANTYDAQANAARKGLPSLAIPAVLDSGVRLDIYGDRVCAPHATTFVHVQSLKQLNIEAQDLAAFCQLWIKNPDLVQ